MIFYSLQVLAAVLPIVIFPFSASLIKEGRHNKLSTAPGRGLSVTWLLFWAFPLIFESMAFVNIHPADWWFQMNM